MKSEHWIFPVNRWLEPLLALLVVGGIVRAIIYTVTHGYLPQPFFYDPYDVWMDWFNTAQWARNAGVYDSWGTVYGPLTFIFFKIFGLSYCYEGSATAYSARSCDWVGLVTLHGFYILNVVIIGRIFYKADRKTWLPRLLALSLGLPMLTSLERGNVIVVGFTCLLLAYGPLVKSARLRWLAAGLAINFKMYMIASLFPHLIRRRWRWVEGAMISIISIYLISYCVYGQGTPGQIFENISAYTEGQADQLLSVWYTGTYLPLISLFNNPGFSMAGLIGSRNAELALATLIWSGRITQLSIVLAAIAAWIRPEAVSMNRLINLGLSLAFVTVESGGYCQMFVIFFCFLEKWEGVSLKIAIVLCYILCFPFDYIVDRVGTTSRDTFFGNSTTLVTYYIMLGPFIRPGLFYGVPFAISCSTIRAVWIDIRLQNWKTRWRFRNDLPIMVGAGSATPPSK